MSERVMLPVLPLRETVVFPGVAVPISAGRPGTLQAVEAALSGDRRIFAVAQRENRDEVEIDNLYTVGTVVRIAQVQRGTGGMQLLIHGEERGLALNITETPTSGLSAAVRAMDRHRAGACRTTRRSRRSSARCGSALDRAGPPPRHPGRDAPAVPGGRHRARRLRRPGGVLRRAGDRRRSRSCWRRSGSRSACASLLVRWSASSRCIEAQEDIQQQVQEELGERQREMLLREQMKAIQRELGEEDEGARGRGAAREDRGAGAPRGRARGGGARARPPGAHQPAERRVPGDPHLPGDDRRPALERADARTSSSWRRPRRSSTRTTTGCRT